MDPFEEFLREHSALKTLLVTPGGNHGDTLIHMGHLKKLEEHGFSYTCFNLEEKYSGNPVLAAKYLVNIGLWKMGSKAGFRLVDVPWDTELIIFEGGGYINDIWYGLTLLNQVLRRNHQPVAVGPQSIRLSAGTIETYNGDRLLHLFCREEASLVQLNQMDLTCNVVAQKSPEVALYLTREDLKEYIEPRDPGYQLVVFRDDKESALTEGLKGEVIMRCDKPVVCDVSMRGSLTDFVSAVEYAEEVYTDRLHVAILGSILGRRVTLFENVYHKNRGVWKYSLRDNVNFVSV